MLLDWLMRTLLELLSCAFKKQIYGRHNGYPSALIDRGFLTADAGRGANRHGDVLLGIRRISLRFPALHPQTMLKV